MVGFIDDHREQLGVEPICRVLPIAPSTYFKRKAEARDPMRRSIARPARRVLRAIIRRSGTSIIRCMGPGRRNVPVLGRPDDHAARS